MGIRNMHINITTNNNFKGHSEMPTTENSRLSVGNLRDVGIVFLCNISAQVSNLIIGMVLVRHLSRLDVSIYRQGLFWASLFVVMAGCLSPLSLLYYMSKHRLARIGRVYTFNALCVGHIFAIFIFVIMYLGRHHIGRLVSNPSLSGYLFWFMVVSFSDVIGALNNHYLYAQGKAAIAAGVSFLVSIIKLILLLIMLSQDQIYLAKYLWASALVSSLYYIWSTVSLLWGGSTQTICFRLDVVRRLLSFSFPIFASVLVAMLGGNIDKILVSRYCGAIDYAVYSLGTYEVPFMALVGSSIMSVMFGGVVGDFARGGETSRRNIISRFRSMFVLCLCFVIPAMLGMVIFSRDVVYLLFGGNNLDAAPIFAIYNSVGFLAAIGLGVLGTAANRQKIIFYAGIVSLLLNALITVVMIRYAGLRFAVLGPVCFIVCNYVLNVAIVMNAYELERIDDLIPVYEAGGILLLSIVVNLISWWVLTLLEWGIFARVIAVVFAWLVASSLSIFVYRGFGSGERDGL